MLKDLNYITFDFETTGLDIEKDEPIQIGIIKFDNNFNIIDYFQSYIKPKKDISKLKDLVSFITGIKIEKLDNAPYMEDIIPRIQDFFDENSVLIGHNINFDIEIMKKYIKIPYLIDIDTFTLSKTILHFLPNYSLEVISEIILSEDDMKNSSIELKNTYHDALYDSFSSYKLFQYNINKIIEIIEKYPVLKNLIDNSESIYKSIFKIENTFKPSKIYIPGLKKEIKNNNSINTSKNYDFSEFKQFEKIYIGNIAFKKLIPRIIGGNKKVILSFSNSSKAQIAKNILSKNNIKNIGHLGDGSLLNENKVKNLLNKEKFYESEINFLIKYFSHYHNGHGMMDINSTEDYKIFNYLKESKQSNNTNIIVTSHHSLFNSVDKEKDLSKYKVIFFDRDWWYNSFLKYINAPFDIYFLINNLENLFYEIEVNNQTGLKEFSKFYNWFIIFTGVLFSEIKFKFINTEETKIELDPIIDNIDFPKTNYLWKKFNNYIKELEKKLQPNQFEEVKKVTDEFYEILDNINLVEKRMYDERKFSFIFYKRFNVINYQEFLSYLENLDILFATNFTKENAYKLDSEENIENSGIIKKIKDTKKIFADIKRHKKIFILSNNKTSSKELFTNLYEKGIGDDYKLLVEKITGGVGKNIFHAQNKEKFVMIGGYDFMLKSIEENIDFDNIIIYNASGPLEKQIINDINYYYGRKNDK